MVVTPEGVASRNSVSAHAPSPSPGTPSPHSENDCRKAAVMSRVCTWRGVSFGLISLGCEFTLNFMGKTHSGSQEPFGYVSAVLSLDSSMNHQDKGEDISGLLCLFAQSSFFFLTALLRFNSHAIKFTHSYSSALLFSVY